MRYYLLTFITWLAVRCRSLSRGIRPAISAILKLYGRSRVVYNINLSPESTQRRIAFVYLNEVADKAINMHRPIYHPNFIQHMLMQKVLTERDYVIDLYPCGGAKPYNFRSDARYDMIIGFGPYYVQLCQQHPQATKVLFITENAPWVVKENYQRRLQYYHSRHHERVFSQNRMDRYTDEMFLISDIGIALTGTYNISKMQEKLSVIYQLPVNAIPHPSKPAGSKDYDQCRMRFLWFGSRGIIHKGLDILIEAFAQMPDLELDIYGAPRKEIKVLKLPPNVHNMGAVDVQSERFQQEVVQRHGFNVSLSCSEGMQTGISTCMFDGLVPIVTRETGFDDCPCAIHFDGWDIDSVVNTIRRCSQMPADTLRQQDEQCRQYAMQHFSTAAYKDNFQHIITRIEAELPQTTDAHNDKP